MSVSVVLSIVCCPFLQSVAGTETGPGRTWRRRTFLLPDPGIRRSAGIPAAETNPRRLEIGVPRSEIGDPKLGPRVRSPRLRREFGVPKLETGNPEPDPRDLKSDPGVRDA